MDEWEKLVCPVCGFEYVAFVGRPQFISGNDNYEALWPGRGDLIIIPFECEEGHRFSIKIGVHKGITYTRIEGE